MGTSEWKEVPVNGKRSSHSCQYPAAGSRCGCTAACSPWPSATQQDWRELVLVMIFNEMSKVQTSTSHNGSLSRPCNCRLCFC